MSSDTQSVIPKREEVDIRYTWDLSSLFPSDEAWEEGLKEFEKKTQKIESFKGTLGKSAGDLRACLDFMMELGKLEERLGYYAHLKVSEDGGNSANQNRFARYMRLASTAETLASYQNPEIQTIPDDVMDDFLKSSELTDFTIYLKKILRFKPHILSEKEERLLAMQIEANQTAHKTFTALTDVDFDFGTIETSDGAKPLTHSTFSAFLENQALEIRRKAYVQFYDTFDKHKNTLASLYNGSVQLDIYQARARNYPSARAAALFPAN
ncbi:MAG: oligoendopeptidase F, partial [Spirochaetota bacterium]